MSSAEPRARNKPRTVLKTAIHRRPTVGLANDATSDWFYGGGDYCNYGWPVYCFEN